MNTEKLNGKRVAILATDGVEQVELTEPREALDAAGAKTQVVSPKKDRIKGWQHDHWGDEIDVDLPLDQANASDFDALVLPGGVMNPDHLRQNPRAVQFVRDFFDAGKPVAAICHGPWMLVEAGVAKGRTITSWPSLQTDLRNAGADWVDREVVVDEGLVSSRKPDDIPAFNAKMIEEFAEGRHDEQRPSAHRSHADALAASARERTTPPREYEVTPNPVAERANERREAGGGIPNMGPESVPSTGMHRAATDPVGSSDWDESNP
jgi:protease I